MYHTAKSLNRNLIRNEYFVLDFYDITNVTNVAVMCVQIVQKCTMYLYNL